MSKKGSNVFRYAPPIKFAMDSLTQVILGASVGYAVAGKQMGKKACLWGAFSGILPDLDFIPILPFKDNFIYLKHHRGFSHSLLFCLFGSGVLSWVLKKVRPATNYLLLFWVFFWGILTHILLDCFTSWGTQAFWPLSYRVSWNSIFIIDPGYTVPLFIGLLGIVLSNSHASRRKWVAFGLIISSFYLVLSLGIKVVINKKFDALFKANSISVSRFTTRPSPFNLILWSSTAEVSNGYYYAMVSLLDQTLPSQLFFVPKNHHLTQSFTDKNTKDLIGYTKGFYTVETNKSGIVIHDLRYGFLGDPWRNGENYVFSYFLRKNSEGDTLLEIKNPRPKNTQKLLSQLWDRLKGI